MAETYGVLDYEALPPQRAAALFCGLRDDARIRLKQSGNEVGTDRLLLASAVDRLGLLVWAKTEDGQRGRNRPPSVVEMLTGNDTRKHDAMQTFRDGAEFEAARARIAGEAKKWQT